MADDPFAVIHEQHQRNLRRIKHNEWLMYAAITIISLTPLVLTLYNWWKSYE